MSSLYLRVEKRYLNKRHNSSLAMTGYMVYFVKTPELIVKKLIKLTSILSLTLTDTSRITLNVLLSCVSSINAMNTARYECSSLTK